MTTMSRPDEQPIEEKKRPKPKLVYAGQPTPTATPKPPIRRPDLYPK